MLVLSRRPNEEVVLPGLGISIKVIETQGNQVRLGISAPDAVRILRGELALQDNRAEGMPDSNGMLHSNAMAAQHVAQTAALASTTRQDCLVAVQGD